MDTNMPELDETIWNYEDGVPGQEPETVQVPLPAEPKWWGDHRVRAAIIVALLIGIVIGQTVGGWWLWPVEWTDATVAEMSSYDKANAVILASRLYAFDGNSYYPERMFDTWDPEERALFICEMWMMSADPAVQANINNLGKALGKGCK